MNETPTLLSEIYETVKQRMSDQIMQSYEEYVELIDQVIDEFTDFGKMTEEEDTKSLREGLERMYWQEHNAQPEDSSLSTDDENHE